MSYIEKEKLIKADIASIENRVRHAFNQGYDLGFKDGKEKTKTLKQEPVLDKIFCIVYPLSIMSTPELEHKAIMQIAEMLEPLYMAESENT